MKSIWCNFEKDDRNEQLVPLMEDMCACVPALLVGTVDGDVWKKKK